MNYIKALLIATALALISVAPAGAALPWGAPGNVTVANAEVSGATPTCTYSSTLFTCIEDMTANVTSVTLAGMTAGTYYTLVFMQDGTGSRTLTQTSITGGSLATGTTAANKYDVWVIKATSATAATFIADYPNAPLWDVWNMAQAGNGTSVANATVQSQPTVVVPGMTANNSCSCVFTNPDANFAKGMSMGCTPLTNAVTCQEVNATAATATPTAGTIAVRIAP